MLSSVPGHNSEDKTDAYQIYEGSSGLLTCLFYLAYYNSCLLLHTYYRTHKRGICIYLWSYKTKLDKIGIKIYVNNFHEHRALLMYNVL